MAGILPVLPASNSYVMDFHTHLQLPLLAFPQTSPPSTAISALTSARDYLEKWHLSLMRWVLNSRQRKLMTTANLLTSISPHCRSWHLSPRLNRRADCLFDLYSLPPQSCPDHRVSSPSTLPHTNQSLYPSLFFAF